jgi:hypothetical protein
MRDWTISETPEEPTLKATQKAWSRNKEVTAKFVRDQFRYKHAEWKRRYAELSPAKSTAVTELAIKALQFDSALGEDDDAYIKLFGSSSREDLFRRSIRPMPAPFMCVEVGGARFGEIKTGSHADWLKKQGMPPERGSNTPHTLYRLLYLTCPKSVDFSDMYKTGLLGASSPCGRFGIAFETWKYEVAARWFVREEYAQRTRPEHGLPVPGGGHITVTGGWPGADNGVATKHPEAARWFELWQIALGMKWMVYGGNNFEV